MFAEPMGVSLLPTQRGATILEVIFAIAIFGVLAAGILGMVWTPLTSAGSASERAQAMLLAKEGVEAAESIRSEGWLGLTNGQHGVAVVADKWAFSGTSDETDIFTRVVTVEDVERDGVGDIVASGGTVDPRTKRIVSLVSWPSLYGGIKTVEYVAHLTNGNTYDWLQTTDTDFNAGTTFQTAVTGTGESASVELAQQDMDKEWTLSGGDVYVQTTDTDFGPGTFTNTAVSGTGTDASVVTTGNLEWLEIVTGKSFYETDHVDFGDGTFADTVGIDTGDLASVTLATVSGWNNFTSPTAQQLNAATFVSSSDGWAVGNSGTILRWNGTSWSTVVSPTAQNLQAVDCLSATNCFATADAGQFIRWNGTSWSNTVDTGSQNYQGIKMTGASDGWATADSGRIARWNGTTWAQFVDLGNQTWRGIDCASASDCFTVGGNQGRIARWNGTTWSQFGSYGAGNQQWYGVDLVSASDGWMVGNNGLVYRWNGTTWSEFVNTGSETWTSVHMLSASDGWIVASDGATRRWNGASWDIVNGPSSSARYGVFAVSATDAWTVGAAGVIWRYGDVYTTSGTYLSGIFDAGAVANWGRLFWGEDLPDGTDLTIATRGGNTPTPDGTWTAWSAELTIPTDATITTVDRRYIQYRATFTTSDITVAPKLENISITYDDPGTDSYFAVVVLPSGMDGWAVGAGGSIARFDGSEWSTVSSPTGNSLNDIAYADENNVWAVGDNGTIIYWNGTSWATQASGTARNFQAIDVVSSSFAVAVATNGVIRHWNGASWVSVASPSNRRLNGVSLVAANDGWIVGNNGTILRWNGTTWSNFTSPTSARLNSVSMATASFGVAVGSGGLALHWNGASWSSVSTTINNELYDVYCIATDNCWAVGVQQTFVGWDGSVWSQFVFDNPSNPLVHGVHLWSETGGWAVGEAGAFYKYATFTTSPSYFQSTVIDGGTPGLVWNTASWDSSTPLFTALTIATRTGPTPTPDGSWSAWSSEYTNVGGSTITSPANQYMQYRVTFTTSNPLFGAVFQEIRFIANAVTGQDLYGTDGTAVADVWAVGRTGVIVYYDGVAWATVLSPTVVDLLAIDAVDASTAFAVGVGGTILRWDGVAWATETSPTASQLNGVHCPSTAFCAAVGGGGTIVHFDGISWGTVSSPTGSNLLDVSCLSDIDCWAVGANGVIIQWDGVTWGTVSSPTAQQLNGVHARSASAAWAVGAGGVIIEWDGANWATVTSPVVTILQDVEARSATEAWAVGNSGTLLEWDGVSWEVFVTPTTRHFYDVTVEAPTDGWVVGQIGVFLKDPPPYYLNGTFTSSVLDTDAASEFGVLYFTTTLPAGTAATIATRSGPVPTPDGTWSAWSGELSADGVVTPAPDDRYLQYRATLTTGDTMATPTLDEIIVTYRQ